MLPTILPCYKELITSSAQLALFTHSQSVEIFLHQLKRLWQLESFTNDQLLSELAACNQQLLDVDIQQLSGTWLPYRYQAKTRSMQWCLPLGHATEPFHDQYIERCRQQSIINQLINPKTSIQTLFSAPINNPRSPAGFIFHLSRCGSTLISGCLAELDSTSVLSESQLLTEILLDFSLTDHEKQQLLPQLVHLQTNVFSERHNIVVKWNAWDLFNWPIIGAVFSQAPIVLLIRNPVEILASHQRMAGRHMAGDPSLAVLNSVFAASTSAETMLEIRITVLNSLINQMIAIAPQANSKLVDYAELNSEKIHELSRYFNLSVTEQEFARFKQRMQFNSKSPEQVFQADGVKKQSVFNAAEQEKIVGMLAPAYQQLLSNNCAQDVL